MYKFRVADMEKHETKTIESIFTKLEYAKLNFLGWGFYTLLKYKQEIQVIDKFSGETLYRIF